MADIHDYLEASRATDSAVSNLQAFGGRIEDSDRGAMAHAHALATLLAAEGIICAIRELGVRLDYVTRDEARR